MLTLLLNCPSQGLNVPCQPCNRGRLKQRLQRYFQLQLFTNPCDHPGRKQRMATQSKKVIVHAYLLNTQGFSPYLYKMLLQRIARSYVGLCYRNRSLHR